MLRARVASPRRGRLLTLVICLVLAALLAGPAVATHEPSGAAGFKTGQDEMLVPRLAGATAEALITVGEKVGGYRFEAIPDGIALRTRGHGRVDVYVNHETSTVPFPYTRPNATTGARPTAANSQNDFDNSQVSRLVLNRHSAGVLSGRLVIPSSANYQRFCSSFLAGAAQGFDREILFTNEEATDFVSRTGTAWPAPLSEPPSEQAGVVVAYDVRTGAYRSIHGMGRLNHENSLAVPGYSELMLVTADDTFSSNPPSSQFYAYFADDTDAVWDDEGSLWGFRADDWASYDDYYDFPVGSTLEIGGEFVALDGTAARGTQSALETESDAQHVFQFIRLEDIAYDAAEHALYVADTGRGSSSAGSNPFASTNGRIWKFRLDPANPRNVLGLSILVEGEGIDFKDADTIHNPDNLEFAGGWLYVTEDPASGNTYDASEAGATGARIWRVDPETGDKEVVFEVDQSADGGATDVDQKPDAKIGTWEASGIVDASAAFGPGAFLVDVQAHSLWVEKALGPDLTGVVGGPGGTVGPDGEPDWTYKREGGQLLLVRVPLE
ncbi:MAG TPA: hypothetical protein VFK38_09130 [Candidatus Limnocylindrales bacterium]|nr:hypothetical protein [Candidatus Limnocylindrales bacterium]